jgi:hypothetical protein
MRMSRRGGELERTMMEDLYDFMSNSVSDYVASPNQEMIAVMCPDCIVTMSRYAGDNCHCCCEDSTANKLVNHKIAEGAPTTRLCPDCIKKIQLDQQQVATILETQDRKMADEVIAMQMRCICCHCNWYRYQ